MKRVAAFDKQIMVLEEGLLSDNRGRPQSPPTGDQTGGLVTQGSSAPSPDLEKYCAPRSSKRFIGSVCLGRGRNLSSSGKGARGPPRAVSLGLSREDVSPESQPVAFVGQGMHLAGFQKRQVRMRGVSIRVEVRTRGLP
jgi:hypothetical protein